MIADEIASALNSHQPDATAPAFTKEALAALKTHCETAAKSNKSSSAYFVHPSRKTYLNTIAQIAKAADRPLVIISANRYVTGQVEEELKAAGIAEQDIATYHTQLTDSQKKEALKAKIFITTPSSFLTLSGKEKITPGSRELILVDGIHRVKDPLIQQSLLPYREKGMVIGFSPMAQLSDGTTPGAKLLEDAEPLLNIDLQQSVDRGESSSTHCIALECNHKPGVKIEGGKKDYSTKERAKLLSPLVTRKAIARLHKDFVHTETGTSFRDKPAVIYCNDIDDAKRTSKHFNRVFGKGMAKVVHSDMDEGERQKLLADFKEGKFRFLATPELTLHGLDAPETSICYMKRATRSATIAGMSGYGVTELSPKNKDKHAFVVTCANAQVPSQITFPQIAGGEEFVPLRSTAHAKPQLVKQADLDIPATAPKIRGVKVYSNAHEVRSFVAKRTLGDKISRLAQEKGIEHTEQDIADFVEDLQMLNLVKHQIKDLEQVGTELHHEARDLLKSSKEISELKESYRKKFKTDGTFQSFEDTASELKLDREKASQLWGEIAIELKKRKNCPLIWLNGVPVESRYFKLDKLRLQVSTRAIPDLQHALKSKPDIFHSMTMDELYSDPLISELTYLSGIYTENAQIQKSRDVDRGRLAFSDPLSLAIEPKGKMRDTLFHNIEVLIKHSINLNNLKMQAASWIERLQGNPLSKLDMRDVLSDKYVKLLEPAKLEKYVMFRSVYELRKKPEEIFPGFGKLHPEKRTQLLEELESVEKIIVLQTKNLVGTNAKNAPFTLYGKTYDVDRDIYLAGARDSYRLMLFLHLPFIETLGKAIAEKVGVELDPYPGYELKEELILPQSSGRRKSR